MRESKSDYSKAQSAQHKILGGHCGNDFGIQPDKQEHGKKYCGAHCGSLHSPHNEKNNGSNVPHVLCMLYIPPEPSMHTT